MAKSFQELEQEMPPESLARAKTRAKEMMAEMLLAEIRKYRVAWSGDDATTTGESID